MQLSFSSFSSFLSNLASENQSAIWSFRYPISFRGTNIIKNNTGSGIALLQSIMEAKGSIWFEGNIAVEGGAIALRDQSVVRNMILHWFYFDINSLNFRFICSAT